MYSSVLLSTISLKALEHKISSVVISSEIMNPKGLEVDACLAKAGSLVERSIVISRWSVAFLRLPSVLTIRNQANRSGGASLFPSFLALVRWSLFMA